MWEGMMLGREGHRSRWSLSLDGEMPSSREFVLFVFESFSAWHREGFQQTLIKSNCVASNGSSAVFLDYLRSDHFL